ncbi:helix-turn-helix domain-containing protein [Aestuariibaculum sp. M13]|uniref:helix-turn-helix domain-containing protein n=1 Tax=Aestuariibaculum sp. M13 TaxID=2967132 RepID=UPI002159D7DA|nr:helix-turn-helix domain-containing protein [Aestuariibaculum sp. M13]MCR8667412.1 helix-turn-helix domain-containing protein [Aestuariibaculum sp. M13]
MEHIQDVLHRIERNQFLFKTVLTFEEGCEYCGISKSKMYKHTSSNNVPYYKPEGKLIFFKREELDEWLLRNRQSTMQEREQEAVKYSLKSRKSDRQKR